MRKYAAVWSIDATVPLTSWASSDPADDNLLKRAPPVYGNPLEVI
jgi:hypothetical protein